MTSLLIFAGVLVGGWGLYNGVGAVLDRVDAYLERRGWEK